MRRRSRGKTASHYYFYFIDEELGLCHVRVPTWCPFRLQVYFNGHHQLAAKLRHAGITHQTLDNSFTVIADIETAQRLARLFEALVRGENNITGLRNKDLQQQLPELSSGVISRALKRLRVHGLVKRGGHTYKYYVTSLGCVTAPFQQSFARHFQSSSLMEALPVLARRHCEA